MVLFFSRIEYLSISAAVTPSMITVGSRLVRYTVGVIFGFTFPLVSTFTRAKVVRDHDVFIYFVYFLSSEYRVRFSDVECGCTANTAYVLPIGLRTLYRRSLFDHDLLFP